MTNSDILKIALSQSAIDAGCAPEDFLKPDNVVVKSVAHPDARRYLKLPFDCNLISYGTNIVASVSEDCREAVTDYINHFPVEHCFETPNLHVLNDAMEKQGKRVCFMAEYFLPDVNVLKALDCPYELRILTKEDFADLYLPAKCWLVGKENIVEIISVGGIDDVTVTEHTAVERVEHLGVDEFTSISVFDKTGQSISIMVSPEDAGKLLDLIEQN